MILTVPAPQNEAEITSEQGTEEPSEPEPPIKRKRASEPVVGWGSIHKQGEPTPIDPLVAKKKTTKNDRKKVQSSKTAKKQEKIPAKNLPSSKPKIVDCKTDKKSKHFYIQHNNRKTRKFVGLNVKKNTATLKVTCT